MLEGDRPSIPVILLAALVVVSLGSIGYAAATSTAAFGPFTTTWEGTSELRGLADEGDREVILGQSVSEYESVEPNGTVAVVISPDETYSDDELESIETYVRRGGTLLVAEAFGPNGNALLEAVGAETRFDGGLLRDEQHHQRSPDFPETVPVAEHPYVHDVEIFVLNHGTALETDEDHALVRSSEFSYLDYNRNQAVDEDEQLAEHPVVAVEPIGNGEVIAVSDPSAFINIMLDRGSNDEVIHNVFDAHERVLFDASKYADIPPIALAVLFIRGSIPLQLGIGLVGLVLVHAAASGSFPDQLRTTVGRKTAEPSPARLEEAEIREYVARQHPDWQPERVDRVVQSMYLDERAE